MLFVLPALKRPTDRERGPRGAAGHPGKISNLAAHRAQLGGLSQFSEGEPPALENKFSIDPNPGDTEKLLPTEVDTVLFLLSHLEIEFHASSLRSSPRAHTCASNPEVANPRRKTVRKCRTFQRVD